MVGVSGQTGAIRKITYSQYFPLRAALSSTALAEQDHCHISSSRYRSREFRGGEREIALGFEVDPELVGFVHSGDGGGGCAKGGECFGCLSVLVVFATFSFVTSTTTHHHHRFRCCYCSYRKFILL